MFIDAIPEIDKPPLVRIAESKSQSTGAPPHELRAPLGDNREAIAPPSSTDSPNNKANDEALVSNGEVVILGTTSSGRKFRPSDWAERLAGVMSTFDEDNRLGYSPYVRPTSVNGIKSVIVDKRLKDIDERAYNFLLGFARDNDLNIQDPSKPSV